MTEADWLAATDPTPMLTFLRGQVSNRKLRLFAVACCRNVWEWLPAHSRRAAEVAERYADRQADRRAMASARREVIKDAEAAGFWDGAIGCGWSAAGWAVWDAAEGAARCSQLAPKPEAFLRVKNARRPTPAMRAASVQACRERRRLQKEMQAGFLRDIFNPFRPASLDPSWLTSAVLSLAQGVYNDAAFERLPILADALMEAGCDDEIILTHCRGDGPHVRGCWVVDAVLGKT